MSLTLGTRLGPYEVTALIGEGGMGKVWRAHHTALRRDDALKVLPDAFASDPERLARFRREAQVLASLNHQNIAHVYGLEQSDGVQALVMELVEGPTLADRLAQGPIPVDEALPIARQIADALEAAHERAIIHRDLKPANIKVRPDGTVKVLDFGLAKALEPMSAGTIDATASPTITSPALLTGIGMLLGTAAYMSPEQARGKSADKRSDMWAFGCVLYEMLAGRRAFAGEDVSDTLAAVLRGEPDWSALPTDTPTNICTLLRRCLRKDRRQRLGDASAARLEIEDVAGPPSPPEAGLVANGRRRALVAGLALLIGAAVAAVAAWNLKPGGDPPQVSRVLVSVAPAEQLAATRVVGRPTRTAMAISPDGKYVVFNATRDGKKELYLRPMDRLEATRIPGTEGSDSPFFSPDGEWVGFWQGELTTGAIGELKKVPVSGGPAVTLCKIPALFGASWGSTNTIVFAHSNGGLWRVSSDGGAPEALTTPDTRKGEFSHRLPQILPEGNDVIFTIEKAMLRWDDAQVVVRSLVTGEQRVLIEGAADARYVRTGHLVYARMGTLMAVPFDVTRLEVIGGPRGIVEDVMQSVNDTGGLYDTGAAQFSVSESGSLVYLPGGIVPDRETSLVWVDRSGGATPLPVTQRLALSPRISPDGTRVAFAQGDQTLWTFDISRNTTSRLSTPGRDSSPIWTPDGTRVTFRSTTSGPENLFWKSADGSGEPERLTTNEHAQTPTSWSQDGKTLAFLERSLDGEALNFDIWILALENGGARARPFIETPFNEQHAEFSPDGRWLAYSSNESGRAQVYVQPYPGPGGKQQVSVEGGVGPAWARNGRELFYMVPEPGGTTKMMAVDVTMGATFTAGAPRVLFEGQYIQTVAGRNYDVTPDGRRFLMVQANRDEEPPRPAAPTTMILVQHWFEELKRLVPTN